MERVSSKHGRRLDEELKHEVRGHEQGIAGGRAEEWRVPEPAGEDEPEVSRVPNADAGADLSRFGRYIGLSSMPGDREALRRGAETLGAPDDVLGDLDRLPDGVQFHTVTEIWAALGRGSADRRPD
ncbi:hypothetical protein Aph02nite_24670 [Actinoplanes philippinensis]|uniref:DUF2795 domain-containing protein n=1 Tax=Actinoplanes philippinensis TaxID=35752 RepID=A0A1I2G0X0_9ACTN|nr:DUF2795 domain-containing protein [Actinoplanes philippinensis]GIE76517.1 hypothetical protein Aph02nite_24670 [Actinoplanes philippinensis]SFF11255.1 Protein of unknown function [Actinoplanes philippinensis]